jgi:hypothetical protein
MLAPLGIPYMYLAQELNATFSIEFTPTDDCE